MSQRRLLVTLTTLAAVFALALAIPLTPAAHAAPPHLPPGAHPYGGNTSPLCSSTSAWYVSPNPQPNDKPTMDSRPNDKPTINPRPNDGPTINSQFNGVAADSSGDVWAVGFATDPTTFVTTTLIEHYYSSWSIVSSPNVAGTDYDSLSGVVALTPDEAWAVGNAYDSSTGTEQALIEQYNGTAWSIVSGPSSAGFSGVAADGPNDVWAVGATVDPSSGTETPLAEHWDGTAWSVVPVPGVGAATFFTAVSVVAGQVFAAGYSIDASSGNPHTLVETYVPESGWSVMATLDGGTNGAQLNSSAALSTSNVWVAGFSVNADGTETPLTEHWDGTAWTIFASAIPSSTSGPPTIYGLSAIPATTRVWAVGVDFSGAAFAEQWEGNVWQSSTAATLAGTSVNFYAVAAVSPTNAWAVGTIYDDTTGITQTLIEHYAGPPAWIFCQ